jgi:hypothetical protein
MSTLQLKQSFLNMFFCLINNYLACYRDLAGTEEEEQQIAGDIFDFAKYEQCFDESRRQFMVELCKTQNFMTFIERSHRVRQERNELQFFVEGVKLCAESGEKALALRVKKITEQLLTRYRKVRYLSHHSR